MNPSVDISYRLGRFAIDGVNRCDNASKTAGGKGLNVSRVIKLLGGDIVATGITGGTTGIFIKRELEQSGIKNDFLETELESRNCIAVLHEGMQTEILESGPEFSAEQETAFLKKFITLADRASLVTVSGSLPRGLSKDFYCKLISSAVKKNIPVLLDCSGKPLAEVLKADVKPRLIKPNRQELAELENISVPEGIEEIKTILQKNKYKDIEIVMVSLGARGAFVKHRNKFYLASIPKVNAVNPVGSGDSTLAGLAVAIEKGLGIEDILKFSMTAGILNALEHQTGFINMDNFEKYFRQIKIEEK
jgi:tagatose 6-phosphate kinase